MRKKYIIYFSKFHQNKQLRNKKVTFYKCSNLEYESKKFIEGIDIEIDSIETIEEKINLSFSCFPNQSEVISANIKIINKTGKGILQLNYDYISNVILFKKKEFYCDFIAKYVELFPKDNLKLEVLELTYNPKGINLNCNSESKSNTIIYEKMKEQCDYEIKKYKKLLDEKNLESKNLNATIKELRDEIDYLNRKQTDLETQIRQWNDIFLNKTNLKDIKSYCSVISKDQYLWEQYSNPAGNIAYYSNYSVIYEKVNDIFFDEIFKDNKKLLSNNFSVCLIGGGSGLELFSLNSTLEKSFFKARVTIIDSVVWPINFFNKHFENIKSITFKIGKFKEYIDEFRNYDLVIFTRCLNYIDMCHLDNTTIDAAINQMVDLFKRINNNCVYAIQVVSKGEKSEKSKIFEEKLKNHVEFDVISKKEDAKYGNFQHYLYKLKFKK